MCLPRRFVLLVKITNIYINTVIITRDNLLDINLFMQTKTVLQKVNLITVKNKMIKHYGIKHQTTQT